MKIHCGERACRTAGSRLIPTTPQAAITANQVSITGPKKDPIRPVPNRWITKSPASTTTANGTTADANEGLMISNPSAADSTEMAGVITLSPRNIAAPNIPTRVSNATAR